MKNPDYKNIKHQIDQLEEKIDHLEVWEFEDEVYELEEKVNSRIQETYDEELDAYKLLANRIGRIKKDNFYDPEVELDRMFPDRHDEDFDEDSMSYDSVFGDD
jgi:hypothetical protein